MIFSFRFTLLVCVVVYFWGMQELLAEEQGDEAIGGKPALVVGTFDSRAVATAYMRSDKFNAAMNELKRNHKEAKAAGDEERTAQLEKKGSEIQHLGHQQVFSNAPIPNVLKEIEDQLDDVAKQAGVDVFRLNFSHGSVEQHASVARRIRKQAALADRYIGILADLQGPKIRISRFRDGDVELATGDRFRLDLDIADGDGTVRGVGLDYPALTESVAPGDTLLLDDGRIRLRVDDLEARAVDCSVTVGGKLSSRKGINRLGGGLAAPALTGKDREDIAGMPAVQPDFVAVSFVSSTGDIENARSLLADRGLDAAVLTSMHNIAYYSGFLYCSFGRPYGCVVTQDACTTVSANIDGGATGWSSTSSDRGPTTTRDSRASACGRRPVPPSRSKLANR